MLLNSYNQKGMVLRNSSAQKWNSRNTGCPNKSVYPVQQQNSKFKLINTIMLTNNFTAVINNKLKNSANKT